MITLTGIPKIVAFFICLAFVIAYFKDVTIVIFGKEDFRSAAIAAARQAIIKHQDWAALRVGDPPYLIREGLEDTISRVLQNNLNVGPKELNVRMNVQTSPALLSLAVDANYSSSLLKLLKENNILVNVPVQTTEIIESKYDAKNYE
ncbi:hypothetical protein FOI68_21605 [Brevibacillus sp. LEMMJ03]|uniref:hypothetical protein n=1 Tax=Brevibacillus sp. LEMMJ03 TaxID=2595056 RepID=UPI00117F15FB|nr:hypothetical protein [Brevibacillus sp. LEMMJ03]TRY23297.1 hypothetical protein FOI68_21605 [Brevibacillus sp. LEMMJ03]